MCGPHHCLGRGAFASGAEILRRLLQLRQNASILEQGCAGFSPGSANRKHQITRHPWRTSAPLRPSLSFRSTHDVKDAAYRQVPYLAIGLLVSSSPFSLLPWLKISRSCTGELSVPISSSFRPL